MNKYRKKPVVIEAFQFDSSDALSESILKEPNISVKFEESGDTVLLIQTLEGVMTAKNGDWIIKGIKGEFYPCRDDIFQATYEKVE